MFTGLLKVRLDGFVRGFSWVERLFRRLKGFRRIFSRFDKPDCVFTFFIHFALITDALISVDTP